MNTFVLDNLKKLMMICKIFFVYLIDLLLLTSGKEKVIF